MDLKNIAEGIGLLGKAKEFSDRITHKDEIRVLEAEVASKDEQLRAVSSALEPLGLSSEQLAMIAITLVAVVAIMTIAAVAIKYSPGVSAA
jgi:hypothetical protein